MYCLVNWHSHVRKSNKEQMLDKIVFCGTPEASVNAAPEAWMKLLAFFHEHLQK